jgi:choline transport protein
MLFAFVVLLLFTIGDVDTVSNTPTGIPLIVIFYEATNSKAATTFLVIMPTLVLFASTCNTFASVSRLIWTFAKDKGLPFSRQLSYVSNAGSRLRVTANQTCRYIPLCGSL